MMLDRNNGLVEIWVKVLNKTNSPYTFDDVPDIYNLRELVKEALEENKEE